MLENLKKEMTDFFECINSNIKDKQENEIIRKKTLDFFESIFKEIDEIIKYKEEKISIIIKTQKYESKKLQELSDKIAEICEDLYGEQEDSFEISCPYCNYTFFIDVVEDCKEIKCPECGNTIELDWDENY